MEAIGRCALVGLSKVRAVPCRIAVSAPASLVEAVVSSSQKAGHCCLTLHLWLDLFDAQSYQKMSEVDMVKGLFMHMEHNHSLLVRSGFPRLDLILGPQLRRRLPCVCSNSARIG